MVKEQRLPRKKPDDDVLKQAKQNQRGASIFDGVESAPAAAEYIHRIEAVPTCLPHFDYKTGIGGAPVSRLIVLHGPSAEGKSTLAMALLRSWIEQGHYAGFADAEHTTPPDYARSVMGAAYDSPLFRSIPVQTYEQVRVDVRVFFERVAAARKAGEVPPETRALVVIDSLKNLMPEPAFEELAKSARGVKLGAKKMKGVDGRSGMLGMMQANYNTAWFIELSSVLYDTLGTIAIIVREKMEETEGFFSVEKPVLVGGREVRFGNHLQLRTTSTPLYVGEGKGKQFIGERHGIGIYKTKVARRTEVIPMAIFHTSNGVDSPEGLDRARDVFELADELKVLELAGSWYSFQGERIGQGSENVLRKLRETPALLLQVERACREQFPLTKE